MSQLSARDPVPALRRDLDLGRVPVGLGAAVFRLRPGDGKPSALAPGYEVSILRMFDGQRTADDIITNCERIGIPLDLEALEGLVEQAEAAGLLADEKHPGVDQPKPSSAHRDMWSPEVRDRFREGLRAARAGDLERASEAVAAMRELDPGSGDALALEDWIRRQHGADLGAKTLEARLRSSEDEWRGKKAPLHVRAEPRFKGGPPRLVLPVAIAAVSLALMAISTFVPISRLEVSSVRLEPLDSATVKLVATVTPQAARYARPGDQISVDLGVRTLTANIESVQGYELVAKVPNVDRTLRARTVEANVTLPARSLWDTLR